MAIGRENVKKKAYLKFIQIGFIIHQLCNYTKALGKKKQPY